MPAILIALLLAAAGWSLLPNDGEPAEVDGDGGIIEQFPVEERAALGPIAGRTIDGGRFDSSEVEGRVLVYNVWASWCSPCRKEAPDLKRLSDELHAKGVRFVGIDVKDNDASAVAFQREFDIKYPSLSARTLVRPCSHSVTPSPWGPFPPLWSSTVRVAWPPGSSESPATTPSRA